MIHFTLMVLCIWFWIAVLGPPTVALLGWCFRHFWQLALAWFVGANIVYYAMQAMT